MRVSGNSVLGVYSFKRVDWRATNHALSLSHRETTLKAEGARDANGAMLRCSPSQMRHAMMSMNSVACDSSGRVCLFLFILNFMISNCILFDYHSLTRFLFVRRFITSREVQKTPKVPAGPLPDSAPPCRLGPIGLRYRAPRSIPYRSPSRLAQSIRFCPLPLPLTAATVSALTHTGHSPSLPAWLVRRSYCFAKVRDFFFTILCLF